MGFKEGVYFVSHVYDAGFRIDYGRIFEERLKSDKCIHNGNNKEERDYKDNNFKGERYSARNVGIFLGLSWIRFWIGMDTDDDNPWMLGLAGLTPGFIFYWIKMSKYRNMDKRHKHESETKSTVNNLKKSDNLREHRKGLSNSRIAGQNDSDIKGVISKNGKEMMGEKMANYLGIDRMVGSKPEDKPIGQDDKK